MMVSTMMLPAAGMPLSMSMMITMDIRVKAKISCKQCVYRLIRAAGHAAVKPDSRIRQRHLRTCSDSAADQGIHSQIRKQARQSAMTASIGAYYLRFRNLTFFNIIYFKLLRMPKMLKYVSIFICDCNFHKLCNTSFSH